MSGPSFDPDDAPDIPTGTIGIPCGDLSRYVAFHASLLALAIPVGSRYAIERSCSVVDNMNSLVAKTRGDWLLILGDDHVMPSDFLRRLLWTMYERDLDAIVPVCLKRTYPYNPVLYDGFDEEGVLTVLDLDAIPEDGDPLVEVVAAGTAGMVVRRRVFEALAPPWFEAGAIPPSTFQLAEDLRFCLRMREAGFKVYAQTDVIIGHITTATLYPERTKTKGWGMKIALDGENEIFLPRTAIT